jgi:DNA processing protein
MGTGRLTTDGPTRQAMRRSMERWRVRLPELPSRDQVLAASSAGIRLICPGDPEWPSQLADLGDEQPYALWLRGNADLRFSCLRSVAIVGSRAATSYGNYVAADFAASVAARGLAVISGGAYGVDAAAHRGALSAEGVTLAVLACGVDVPYPVGHAELFDAIAAQGVLVSEWPPGRTVTRLRFLVRNRTIAALAAGTLVVEAGQRSGAVNTARHARDLGRRLMAVPGCVTSEQSAGCHQIIRDWQGTLVTSAAEVMAELSAVTGPPAAAYAAGAPAAYAAGALPVRVTDAPGRATQATGTAPAKSPSPAPVLDRDQLDMESLQVLDALPARDGLGTLRIAQRAGLAPAATVRCLGELATAGFVERCKDGWRLRRHTPRR